MHNDSLEELLTTDQPTFPLEGELVVISGRDHPTEARDERIRRLNDEKIYGDIIGEVGVVVSRTDRNGMVELPTGQSIFVWLADIEPVRGTG